MHTQCTKALSKTLSLWHSQNEFWSFRAAFAEPSGQFRTAPQCTKALKSFRFGTPSKLRVLFPFVQLSRILLLLTDPTSGQPHRSQVVRQEILAAHLKSALPGALGWLPRGSVRGELSPEDLAEVQQVLSRRKSRGLEKSSSASGESSKPGVKREGNEHDDLKRAEKGKVRSQTVGGAENGEVGGKLLGLASWGLIGGEGIADGACSGGFGFFPNVSPVGVDVERDSFFIFKELDGKRRWFDVREGKLAGNPEGAGGFVLVTNLQPCTEFQVRT
jgi:hypothetical protein